ncbi:hybrid sensor histidine kinase/response regulator [Haliangium ochraceum]|uniref:hybrid sensor histidine kinase/response regulator n=1 Tax=Haliangium ochraceum TaxID=80816 RepID=UPI00019BA66E|nr:hybrid sensor histidine kinase/response regulator [Haliangium ochraceum]
MVVDDDPANLRLVEAYLADLDVEVSTALSGEQGVEQAREEPPHLVLLDIMLPGIDGLEACRRIRAAPRTRDVPVIFMTALSDHARKLEGFGVGGVDYVTKPLDRPELLARVRTHLRIQKMHASLQRRNLELSEMARTLESRTQELASASSSKNLLLAVMAHDLMGPFTPILGFSELLRDSAETLPRTEIRELGGGIHLAAQHCVELLQNLLDWARLEQMQVVNHPRATSLFELVSIGCAQVSLRAEQKKIALRNDIDPSAEVHADERLVAAVLRNLLVNAIKFTRAGGSVQIAQEQLAAGNDGVAMLAVSVIDDGVGIDGDTLVLLNQGQPLPSTEGTERERGTGLGLSICHQIVGLIGGSLCFDSSPGHGTTATFTLPLMRS